MQKLFQFPWYKPLLSQQYRFKTLTNVWTINWPDEWKILELYNKHQTNEQNQLIESLVKYFKWSIHFQN